MNVQFSFAHLHTYTLTHLAFRGCSILIYTPLTQLHTHRYTPEYPMDVHSSHLHTYIPEMLRCVPVSV